MAGLVAADHMYELALERDELMQHAAKVEGHPDNVAASLYGSFVICANGDVTVIEPPAGPRGGRGRARTSRADDGGARGAARAGAARGRDASTSPARRRSRSGWRAATSREISRGLEDRLHQPHRAAPLSALDGSGRARADLGALGATISGAGPTVLFWVFFEQTGALVDRLREEVDGWAEIRRLNFVALGADVAEL